MLLEGLHIPLTTPFHPDGRLNAPKLAANVARYSKTPAAGLIVLGPSGEATMLSDNETREALRTAAEAASAEKVLIAGISRDSVHNGLALADFAAAKGYDAILVGAPTMAAGTARSRKRYDELLLFFQAIADRSPLPVIIARTSLRPSLHEVFPAAVAHSNVIGTLYTWPGGPSGHRSGIKILWEQTVTIKREVTVTHTFAAVTARMKRAQQLVPALISAGSLTGAATAVAEPLTAPPALRIRNKAVGFQIISGNTAFLLDSLNAGATAVAPAFAACAPQACYEVFAAWKDDDQPLAEEKQLRLNAAAHLAEAIGPGGLKFACDLSAYFGGRPRLPLLPPSGAERAELEQLMKGLL
jgi:dihydrodipicolinate synthase/N-acetylneuraminate lyase